MSLLEHRSEGFLSCLGIAFTCHLKKTDTVDYFISGKYLTYYGRNKNICIGTVFYEKFQLRCFPLSSFITQL